MPVVKLHFYKGKTLISRAIKLFTFSKYSHVSIETRGVVYEAWQGGVQKSNTPSRLHKDGTKFDTIELIVTEEQENTIFSFCDFWVGEPYGYLDILNYVFRVRKNAPGLICSELARQALVEAGITYPYRICSPEELFLQIKQIDYTLKKVL
jgi:uncharacterized protein YycO